MQNNAVNIPSLFQNFNVLLEHVVRGCCWNFIFSNGNKISYILLW